MICNSKTEFLSGLRVALERNHITDTRDILTDFRQHFEDGEAAGESEQEVCRKLGDIDEIIKQYISEDAEVRKASAPNTPHDASGFGADNGTSYQAGPAAPQPYSQQQYGQQAQYNAAPEAFQPSAGKIVGVICLDLFLYSWALPTLVSLIISLMAVAISFAVTGLAIFIVAIISCFVNMSGILVTGFASVSLIFLGLMISALAGMLVIASISSVKGFINLVIAIMNQHAKVFTGRKPFNKIGKGKKEAQQNV